MRGGLMCTWTRGWAASCRRRRPRRSSGACRRRRGVANRPPGESRVDSACGVRPGAPPNPGHTGLPTGRQPESAGDMRRLSDSSWARAGLRGPPCWRPPRSGPGGLLAGGRKGPLGGDGRSLGASPLRASTGRATSVLASEASRAPTYEHELPCGPCGKLALPVAARRLELRTDSRQRAIRRRSVADGAGRLSARCRLQEGSAWGRYYS